MAKSVSKTKLNKTEKNETTLNLLKSYKHVLIVDSKCTRSSFIHEFRNHVRKDSKVLYGKKKVLMKSLESAKIKDLDTFYKKMTGSSFLLFTNREVNEMVDYIRNVEIKGNIKPNEISPVDTVLQVGVIKINEKPVPVSMDKIFRQCEMPILIENGKIILETDFLISEKDQPVTINQAKLLKIFGFELAFLKMDVIDSFTIKEKLNI